MVISKSSNLGLSVCKPKELFNESRRPVCKGFTLAFAKGESAPIAVTIGLFSNAFLIGILVGVSICLSKCKNGTWFCNGDSGL